MSKMQIQINEKLIPTLSRIAESQGMTLEEYAANYINNYLVSQWREELLNKIKGKGIEDVEKFSIAIEKVDSDLKIASDILLDTPIVP